MSQRFDPDETDLLQGVRRAMDDVRRAAGPCPPPDLLMAVTAGVETEASARVREHLAHCPACQALLEAFEAHESTGVTDIEDRRIRAGWASKTPRRWQPFVLVAAAAVVVLAVVASIFLRREGPATVTAVNTPPATAPAPAPRTAFVLKKAAIKVPVAAVLTYRSDAGDAKRFLNDFAAAMEPYKNDDFTEAARRLEAISTSYGSSPEIQYYLGVSRLFLPDNARALEALDAASRLAGESLRDDVAWYRAIALERVGRTDDAKSQLSALCGRAGDYRQQACAAIKEIGQR